VIEPAIWIENVPFNETRDYVKKVSTNYAVYTALITGRPAPLKPRLGPPIGPLGSAQPAGPADLP
jgi:soluble lytic murein transglycosylase